MKYISLVESLVSLTLKFGPPLSWGITRIKKWLLKVMLLNKKQKEIDLEKVKYKHKYWSMQESTWTRRLTQNSN